MTLLSPSPRRRSRRAAPRRHRPAGGILDTAEQKHRTVVPKVKPPLRRRRPGGAAGSRQAPPGRSVTDRSQGKHMGSRPVRLARGSATPSVTAPARAAAGGTADGSRFWRTGARGKTELLGGVVERNHGRYLRQARPARGRDAPPAAREPAGRANTDCRLARQLSGVGSGRRRQTVKRRAASRPRLARGALRRSMTRVTRVTHALRAASPLLLHRTHLWDDPSFVSFVSFSPFDPERPLLRRALLVDDVHANCS